MTNQTGEWCNSVADRLEARHSPKRVMVGFDGFVDEIIHVVAERTDKDHFTRVETIADWASRIAGLAGLSGAFELASKQVKLGGNGPIMANALLEQEHRITYIGAIGLNGIHPIFQDLARRCEQVISVCDPAYTDALEFNDGKVMLSKATELDSLDWEKLTAYSGGETLGQIAARSAMLAFTNWTAIHGMNTIITGFTDILREKGTRPYAFFDLADPSKRTPGDIGTLFGLIGEMGKVAQVVFGMNKHESDILAPMLGVVEEDLVARARGIREALGIAITVIHPVHGAAAADGEGSYWVDGPYVEKPVLTTGAGDNFNAGFCHGLLSGMTLRESLLCGVSTSGYYVRNAHSPSSQELTGFIRSWGSGSMT